MSCASASARAFFAVAALAPAIAAPYTRFDGLLTAEYAEREISHHDSIFYELWSNGWERLRPGKEACWDGQPGGADAFFEGVRRGTTCSANWFSAAKGDLAVADARARFTGHAPALLGFDPDIYDYCSDLNGQSHSFTGNDWQAEFSLRCIRANRNVLRVQQGSSPPLAPPLCVCGDVYLTLPYLTFRLDDV